MINILLITHYVVFSVTNTYILYMYCLLAVFVTHFGHVKNSSRNGFCKISYASHIFCEYMYIHVQKLFTYSCTAHIKAKLLDIMTVQ